MILWVVLLAKLWHDLCLWCLSNINFLVIFFVFFWVGAMKGMKKVGRRHEIFGHVLWWNFKYKLKSLSRRTLKNFLNSDKSLSVVSIFTKSFSRIFSQKLTRIHFEQTARLICYHQSSSTRASVLCSLHHPFIGKSFTKLLRKAQKSSMIYYLHTRGLSSKTTNSLSSFPSSLCQFFIFQFFWLKKFNWQKASEWMTLMLLIDFF